MVSLLDTMLDFPVKLVEFSSVNEQCRRILAMSSLPGVFGIQVKKSDSFVLARDIGLHGTVHNRSLFDTQADALLSTSSKNIPIQYGETLVYYNIT